MCIYFINTLYKLLYLFPAYDIKIEAIKKLEETTCYKIKQYLIMEPRSSTTSETKKFLSYFVHCPVCNHYNYIYL